ncbi:MAG: hypothetical protein RSC99_09210 [Clostridiales bacterium]
MRLSMGIFDFDGDGKTSIDEEYLPYKIFEDSTEEDGGELFDYDDEAKKYNIEHCDYLTIDEYEEA